MKKWLALFMACCLTLSAGPVVYGQGEGGGSAQSAPIFKDLSRHWAQSAADRMVDLELMQGDGSGSFRPNDGISRAEFASVLYRMFGFTGQGSFQFEDIRNTDWFYEAIMHANGSGIVQGISQTQLSPHATITREDAAVMIDRAFQLSTGAEGDVALRQFADANDISGYASKSVSYLVSEGFLRGYNGKLEPKSPITRAEAATLLSNMVTDAVKTPGVYDAAKVNGNLILRAAGITLKNTVIEGNLLLAEGIGEGEVQLEGVKVTGTVVIKGGGNHSVLIGNSELNRVVVDKNGDSPVRVVFQENSKVKELLLLKKAVIEQSVNSPFETLTVGLQAGGTELKLQGEVGRMAVEAAGVTLNGDQVEAGFRGSRAADATQPSGQGTAPSASGGSGGSTITPPGPQPSGEKPVAETTIPDSKWQLAWQDEFNGAQIDSSNWTVENTGLVYNNELQYYSPNNVSLVKDGNRGVLQIEAKKGGYGSKDYSSGKLTSKNKRDWTYGKIVVRAKMPKQQGMWPAIWMMPTDEAHYGGWPASGEIDIMELLGGTKGSGNPSQTYSTIHYDSVQPDGSHGHDQGIYALPDGATFADDYHDFQLEWLPGVLRFYVDGDLVQEVERWQTKAPGQPEYYTYPAPFDRDFYLILNLAVGGDWPGAPDPDFASETMKVDFVRVYNYKDLDSWPDVTGNPPAVEPKRDPQADGNLLYNENFTGVVNDQGIPESWEFLKNAGGDGSVEIINDQAKGKAVKMTIDHAGAEIYSLQLTQMPLYIAKDKKYKVSFEAKASANRSIMSKITQFGGSWKAYSGEKTFDLTTAWQPYSYEFEMRSNSDNNARFEFNAGKNAEAVYFANVRVEEIGDAVPLPVERKPLPDLNLIYNGTFDQGSDRLAFWDARIASGAHADISVNNFRKSNIMERQLVVNTVSTGAPEDVVVAQPGLPLEANATYGLYFEAKADTAGSMSVGMVSQGGHGAGFPLGKTAQLTTEMKNYAYEIVIGDGTAVAESELQLLFGGSAGTVYMDNVRLVKRGNPVTVDGYAHIPAKDAWVMNGLQLENSDEGGQHVAYMAEGDLLQFKSNAARDGEYVLSARVASGVDDSYIRLSVKDEDGKTVTQATYDLGETGGWQRYKTIYFGPVQLDAAQSYYLDFEGYEYNTLWVDISENKVKNDSQNDWQPVSINDFSRSGNGELILQVADGTSNWWDVQLQQFGISLDEGKHYRLEFDASATEPKALQAVLGLNGIPYTKYLEQPAPLTTGKQHYSFTFEMTEKSDSQTQLAFGLGNPVASAAEHTVSISNVRLYEVNPAAEQGGQPQNVNLISNESNWFSYSDNEGELALKIENGALQASIGSAGSEEWSRQLIYEGFAIQEGYQYSLSFTAKAGKERKLGIGVGWLSGAPDYAFTDYYGNLVELTDQEETFSFNFVINKAGYSNSRISFNMGNFGNGNDSSNTITISDVRLINMGAVK